MNKIDPFISVIIPVYNRSNTIAYCINSVLKQTYQNFEILIIDDASTDNTLNILKTINDNRIKIIKLELNRGAQYARNIGIKNAKGDWIAFLDSDDEWLPFKLEKQVVELEKVNYDPYTLVYCGVKKKDWKTGKESSYKRPILKGKDLFAKQLINSSPLFQALMTSKIALEEIGYLDEKLIAHQERDTCIRLSKICRYIYIPEELLIYYVNRGDSISNNYAKNIDASIYILKKYREDIIKYHSLRVYEKLLSHQLKTSLDCKLFNKYDEIIVTENVKINTPLRIYLYICRLLKIKPSNILFNILRVIIINLR